MIKKNDIRRVIITDVNNLGYGVARIDGKVTFVSGGVTGDEADIKIIKISKDYLIGKLENLVVGSPHRTESECKYSKNCGGCVYSHISYEHELELKRAQVEAVFKKEGFQDIKVNDVLSGSKIYGYRNKIQCPVGDNFETGFYAERSHEIVPIENCILQENILRDIFAYVRVRIEELKIREIRHIYLRCGVMTGEVMVCFVSRKRDFAGSLELSELIAEKFPDVVSVVINYNPEDTNVILGKECRTIYGKDSIDDVLCGLKFTIHPLSFYQVNHEVAELLYAKASELAGIGDGDRILDLFCGIGTIGLSMISDSPGAALTGVEIIPEAVENAKLNAQINGISNCVFICGAAENTDIPEADIVILDPPRRGCDEKLIGAVSRKSPKNIMYISCNPSTLARDINRFKKYGYQAEEVQPVDMFPRTGHVETVVLMSRVDK